MHIQPESRISIFELGDSALLESEEGGVSVVTIVAITRWLEGFKPPVEYTVLLSADSTICRDVRPELLQPLQATR